MNVRKGVGQNFPDSTVPVDSGSLGSKEKLEHAPVFWDDKAKAIEKKRFFSVPVL